MQETHSRWHYGRARRSSCGVGAFKVRGAWPYGVSQFRSWRCDSGGDTIFIGANFPRLSDEYPSIHLSAGSRSLSFVPFCSLALLLSLSLSLSLALALSPRERALSLALCRLLSFAHSLSLFNDLSIYVLVYLFICLSMYTCTYTCTYTYIYT